MLQRTDDQFDWTRTDEATPSSETGPARAASGTFYIFIETSSPRVRGDAAALVSFRTTVDSLSSHTFLYIFLRGIDIFPKGTDQGVESVHDFFYTRKFSTLYFGKNIQYLNDIYM